MSVRTSRLSTALQSAQDDFLRLCGALGFSQVEAEEMAREFAAATFRAYTSEAIRLEVLMARVRSQAEKWAGAFASARPYPGRGRVMDERTRFEHWITKPPYEREVTRFPMDASVTSWPGQYDDYAVQLAWDAWQMNARHQRQVTVAHWCAAAFGSDQAASVEQRGLRHVEEAIEAAQAAGCAEDQIMELVRYVFARPAGSLGQELGGSGLTLLALAQAANLDADACEVAEVERVLAKPFEHFWKRNQAKNEAGFLAGELASRTGKDALRDAAEECICCGSTKTSGPLCAACEECADAEAKRRFEDDAAASAGERAGEEQQP